MKTRKLSKLLIWRAVDPVRCARDSARRFVPAWPLAPCRNHEQTPPCGQIWIAAEETQRGFERSSQLTAWFTARVYVFVSVVGGRWGRRGVGFLAASRALKLGSRAVRSLEKTKGRRLRCVPCPTARAPPDKRKKSSGGAVLRIFSRTCICMVSTGGEGLNPSFLYDVVS